MIASLGAKEDHESIDKWMKSKTVYPNAPYNILSHLVLEELSSIDIFLLLQLEKESTLQSGLNREWARRVTISNLFSVAVH